MVNQYLTTSPTRKLLIILAIALLLAGLEIAANFPNVATPLERLELSASDTAVRALGGHSPSPEIVIVAIDDESLVWVDERWPWSRARMAEIVDWLAGAGARIIAYDIFLFEPSADPADDAALAEAFARANTVVTVSQIFDSQFSTTLDRPNQVFLDVVDGYGITEIERDDDAIVRSVTAYKSYQDQFYFHWAFEIARLYQGGLPISNPTQASLIYGSQTVPLNQRSSLMINYAGPTNTYPTYSAAYVPLGDYDPALFRDKIVLIGATSETMQDLYPTPFSATSLMPGVEVVANTVDTILTNNYITLTPPWVTVLIISIMAGLAMLGALVPRPTLSIISMLIGIGLYLTLRQVIYTQLGVQIAIVSPALMLMLGVVIPSLDQAVTQELEKRRLRSLFNQFISPQMVNQLLETQDITSLNKRTELTILFSDIRGFTSISEQMLPEEVVSLLNPYLSEMSKVIHKYGGTVDKYEGDAIVAFFGEPIPFKDHALRAAMAALEMRSALARLNQQWQQTGIFRQKLEMGIGINTGEVFVGLLGSEQRVNYTVIGDAANLAARLQDQTKETGDPILLSESTYQLIKTKLRAEFVGARTLKGRSESVNMYRLVSG